MSGGYPFAEIEPRWQGVWQSQRTFAAVNPGQPGGDKPKYYVLDFFPYPSGAGLHVGHPLGYIATDIIARYRRMCGYNVLHPMGWDAFGLPAEQYAIETGVHPAITTQKNIDTYKRQLRMIGLAYDWDREIATCTPDYYRWTQWIFLQLFNAWYDPALRWTDPLGRKVVGRARHIRDLPIPAEDSAGGERAIEDYRSKHRLAFLAEVPVNWCPALGTVLANEEVTADGKSERGNHPVYRRPMKQWMLRITAYCDRLLTDLEPLDWPEPIKLMQRNWIGRSEGAYVDFRVADGRDAIRVFTTRPDTLFGATYVVLAPEHALVAKIVTSDRRAAVDKYVAQAKEKSDLDRTADSKVKTGEFTGAYAINPVNGQRVPIWIADYVLAGYGTGAIMAVPAHDTRDLEFAQAFKLPVVPVVQPPAGVEWRGFVDDGVAINSPAGASDPAYAAFTINGLPTPEAKRKITAALEQAGLGKGTVQYKLRDWLFSRQRYWGEPFPIAHRPDGRVVDVPESALPVALPEMADFRPTASDDPNAEPATPLSRSGEWTMVELDGVRCRRELNTMPQWAGSCWYYLRFIDPKNDRAFVDAQAERYWMRGPGPSSEKPRIGGVDLYMGGAEHAVLHLLYARFWHKALFDLGHVSTPEPFQKLFNQGMIGAASYRDERGTYVPASEVVEGVEQSMQHPDADETDQEALRAAIAGGLGMTEAKRVSRLRVRTKFSYHGAPVFQAFEKMSKSLKNVVNPDEIVTSYGADTLRLYEMYMGPLEKSKPWNTNDIIGVNRFLQRVWRLIVDEPDEEKSDAAPSAWTLSQRISDADDPALEKLLHKTIQKVTDDYERFSFNTAIAHLIVWSNEAQKSAAVGRSQVMRFLRLLAPMAPHISEELWSRLGQGQSIALASWPQYDAALTRDDTVEVAVQVNGKVRGRIQAPADADEATLRNLANEDENIRRAIDGKAIRKAIVVPNRLLNLIV
ncbi:MAG: leucine--tRNA ligase [Phycisphaerae bacterium]|nr:leucine--tRNA ligase [Phycisphaerae bacterium]